MTQRSLGSFAVTDLDLGYSEVRSYPVSEAPSEKALHLVLLEHREGLIKNVKDYLRFSVILCYILWFNFMLSWY